MVKQNDSCCPAQQQATVLITLQSFDKRALTTSDPLSLAHSVLNLSYLSAASPFKIVSLLSTDGGLQLLIRILSRVYGKSEMLARLTYSATLSSLSNMAVRGNQSIRTTLSEARVIPPLIQLLVSAVEALKNIKSFTETPKTSRENNSNTQIATETQQLTNRTLREVSQAERTSSESIERGVSMRRTESIVTPVANRTQAPLQGAARPVIDTVQPMETDMQEGTSVSISAEDLHSPIEGSQQQEELLLLPEDGDVLHEGMESESAERTEVSARQGFRPLQLTNILLRPLDNNTVNTPAFTPIQGPLLPPVPLLPEDETQPNNLDLTPNLTGHMPGSPLRLANGMDPNDPLVDLFYKFEDVVLAIKIIAYLSKYQDLRYELHTKYSQNVFSLVEPFTIVSDAFPDLRKWAIIAMRNAFKRDSDKKGLRRCGNMNCSRWEQSYREFSKCSRCKRVAYCRYAPFCFSHRMMSLSHERDTNLRSKNCQRIGWPLHRNWCLLDSSKRTSERQTTQQPVQPETVVTETQVNRLTQEPEQIPQEAVDNNLDMDRS